MGMIQSLFINNHPIPPFPAFSTSIVQWLRHFGHARHEGVDQFMVQKVYSLYDYMYHGQNKGNLRSFWKMVMRMIVSGFMCRYIKGFPWYGMDGHTIYTMYRPWHIYLPWLRDTPTLRNR